MSLNLQQLRTLIIGPALETIDLWSQSAENLVLGTILTESRAEYLKQVGGGPALGMIQMEPATHNDIWRNYLAFNTDLAGRLRSITPKAGDAHELIGNLWYAAAMCRVFYRRCKDPIPSDPGDALAMAKLWKLRYNTPLGAGTVEKALPYFEQACRS